MLTEKQLENLNKYVRDLQISIRSRNNLKNDDIKRVWQLCECSEIMLVKTYEFGRKACNEIKNVLEDLDLELNMDLSSYRDRLI